jgi:hypothetical protein
MEEKRNFLDHEGMEEIFSAVVEVCLQFRRLQEEGHVMCFTWSAVRHLLTARYGLEMTDIYIVGVPV